MVDVNNMPGENKTSEKGEFASLNPNFSVTFFIFILTFAHGLFAASSKSGTHHLCRRGQGPHQRCGFSAQQQQQRQRPLLCLCGGNTCNGATPSKALTPALDTLFKPLWRERPRCPSYPCWNLTTTPTSSQIICNKYSLPWRTTTGSSWSSWKTVCTTCTRSNTWNPRSSKISQETLKIVAALAHCMGILHFKSKLDSLAFMYLYPWEYRHL